TLPIFSRHFPDTVLARPCRHFPCATLPTMSHLPCGTLPIPFRDCVDVFPTLSQRFPQRFPDAFRGISSDGESRIATGFADRNGNLDRNGDRGSSRSLETKRDRRAPFFPIAGGGDRTLTGLTPRRILSPLRLPIPPLRPAPWSRAWMVLATRR